MEANHDLPVCLRDVDTEAAVRVGRIRAGHIFIPVAETVAVKVVVPTALGNVEAAKEMLFPCVRNAI